MKIKNKKERIVEVDNFKYILEKSAKIIGIISETPSKYSIILKPRK